MRILGLVVALGAITWVMYQASSQGEAETIIPAGYHQALQKAKSVEQVLLDAAQKKGRNMEEVDH